MKYDPGIGATNELTLRVSVATLVRVLFKHPGDGDLILALERKATLHGNQVEIKSQPFGEAIRILDVDAIRDLLGEFHFDSERSRAEQDFRLFIRPSDWSALREFCLRHINVDDDPILETNPERELVEEFYDTLQINLSQTNIVVDQWQLWSRMDRSPRKMSMPGDIQPSGCIASSKHLSQTLPWRMRC